MSDGISLESQQKLVREARKLRSKETANILKGNMKENILLNQKREAEESLRRRCNRVINQNKYERNAPEIRSWWYQLFEILEDDAAIAEVEKMPVLVDMFKITLLLKVLKVCKTRERRFKEKLDAIPEDDIIKLRGDEARYDDSDVPTNKRIIQSDEDRIDHEDLQYGKYLESKLRQNISEKVLEESSEIAKSKMYMDFFKRKPNRAAVWRTLPPLSMSEMNLNQKADAVTKQIATDFINWLKDLGGEEDLSLSVESIIEMFEIGFHANSATSLKVCVKETPSVPRKVAEAKHLPMRAKRAVLRREIKKDINASKKTTTYTAFGRRLPSDMQVRPPAENYYRKWMSCDRVPEKLASMAAVWQGITHLRSTKAYCEFLIHRPEIKPPKYLLDCGMMDLKNLHMDAKSEDISEILSEGLSFDMHV